MSGQESKVLGLLKDSNKEAELAAASRNCIIPGLVNYSAMMAGY